MVFLDFFLEFSTNGGEIGSNFDGSHIFCEMGGKTTTNYQILLVGSTSPGSRGTFTNEAGVCLRFRGHRKTCLQSSVDAGGGEESASWGGVWVDPNSKGDD